MKEKINTKKIDAKKKVTTFVLSVDFFLPVLEFFFLGSNFFLAKR